MHSNPYVSYYLAQQQGHGMPVFHGSLWQKGQGQMGYGLGNLFRSLAKVVTPMLKRGGKALGKIVATTGEIFSEISHPEKTLKKPQKQEAYKPSVPQKPKPWNICKQTNKQENNLVAEDVANV